VNFLPPGARRACVILGATLSGGVLVSANVGAAPGVSRGASSTVARAMEELRQAPGAEKYGALRALWRQWDQTDPAVIEEAITQVAQDKSLAPPVRSYASIIAAYARRRRGDLDGARAKVRAAGLVDRWVVLGPFDNEGKEGLDRPLPPEQELDAPLDLMRPYQGKERQVRWRVAPDVYGFGWLDLGDLVRPRENVCVYATTFVRAKGSEARPATLWAGASGSFKLFWNGTEVLTDLAYRSLDADRFGVPVTMAKGWNRLTAKVCGDDDPPMLSLRVADAKGGPDASFEFTADPSVSAEAAKNAASAKKPAHASDKLEGPIPAFEKLVAGKTPNPHMLEAYAKYLRLTGGDDPSQHFAQDLARRAANAAPTLARHLLAADLSDDRNEKREWLDKAQALVGPNEHPVELLLAQAELARTSTNWRDATPYYDQVLTRDPLNIRGVLGRVELYREAGLKRTAMLTLESAIDQNPLSVALLRVYATALRDVGRTTEADEAGLRYSALRFDDTNYLSERIDLAVMRRDQKAAARWIDRLLASDPDSAWALSVAARASRALGQEPQAIAYYKRALELSPEDVETLRALADLYAESGKKEEQLKSLRQILAIRPQEKDVREYVEHIEPPKPRADEQYAWPAERFLEQRKAKTDGQYRRTLRDLTVTTVFQNGLASRFHQVVFQPLTDEAAAAAREYAFSYQADNEVVQLRAAKVYRENGKIDEAIESGEGPADNPAIATYTSARTFYVHFPRLNKGDVVELRYRIEDVGQRNEFSDYFGEIVYLQQPEPVYGAEYVLRTPKARSFYFHASPIPGLVRSDTIEGDTRVYSFKAAEVAPLLPEPTMPPFGEVLAHVHVSTYQTWDQIAAWYSGLAKDQLKPDDDVRKRVAALTKGLTDPADKVRAIYDEVVQRTRYVALEFGIYGYKPRPCALTFARGWGDCKDKATLIVTMLKEAGIPASLVMVRTGMRGEFETAPASLAPFDHAIAYVPSMNLFLDGTAEYTGSNELPAMDRGALALVVDESGKGKLTHLPDPDADATRRSRKIDAVLAADGMAQLDIRTDTTGALASEERQRYHAGGTRRERLGRDLAAEFAGFELAPGAAAIEMNDLEDIEQPVKMHAKGKGASLGRRDGGDISIPVGPLTRMVPTFASLSTRKQDIRLHVRSTLDDELVIHLPPSLKVRSLPEPMQGDTPFGAFSISAESAGGKVILKSSLAIRKTRIKPAEYAAWRSFCESADRAFSQRLVLGGAK
jgi:tetratricopeptide (TPR) repeat protein/transglutaminase-like putative cysteine protease